MTVSIVFPFAGKEGVKSIMFTILSREYPLRLIEITNFIRKRYGKSVTFQAVRKAAMELEKDGVLVREDGAFQIRKEWIFEAKKSIDTLYDSIYTTKTTPKKFDSIGEEMSVFTFDSLGAMMTFWEDLIEGWLAKSEKANNTTNCYQSAHVWEALIYPQTEQKVMEQLKQKGIQSYVLCTSNTPLDRAACSFYKKIGVKVSINQSSSLFNKEYFVGTYGDLVVQTRYPKEIVDELDLLFKNAKDLATFDLTKLTKMINKKIEIKLSVTKNIDMAKQINHSIISQMEIE